MKNQQWTTSDIPSLHGKIALVTGANSGLGYYASRALAHKGAHVIMASRSKERAQSALNQISNEIPKASIEFMVLDLSSMSSIHAFAGEVQQKFTQLDILINNAGVMGIPRRTTADGFEMQFGTNHLGHFALTGLMLNTLQSAPAGRVVNVSSMLHRSGKMNFDDLMGEKLYDPWGAYAQSKLANLLFSYELQRRLSAKKSAVISIAAHPGYASTNLQLVSAEMKGSKMERGLMQLANTLFAQPAEQGALPELFAATAPYAQAGSFIGPDGWGGSRGFPVAVQSSERSYDLDSAQKLWQVSEELTGVSFSL